MPIKCLDKSWKGQEKVSLNMDISLSVSIHTFTCFTTDIMALKSRSWVLHLYLHCSDGEESACNAGDTGSIPVSGRFPGEGHGNPRQYSFFFSTSVFLPGESHGQMSLMDYSPRGRKESEEAKQLHFHFPTLFFSSSSLFSKYPYSVPQSGVNPKLHSQQNSNLAGNPLSWCTDVLKTTLFQFSEHKSLLSTSYPSFLLSVFTISFSTFLVCIFQ